MTRTEVLVVGGGPAGASLAALAARAGARVVLLERDRFPREKVCGEFLSAEGCAVLGRLGVLDALRAAGGTSIDRFAVSAPSGRRVEGSLPDLPGIGRSALGISRALLDLSLFDLAARSGAEARDGVEAVAPIVEQGRVTGVRVRRFGSPPGSEESLTAPIVVAGDGRRSTIQRALDPRGGDPIRSTPGSWFGLKRHLRMPADRLGGNVEIHLFDGGYAGLGAIEGGRANLCLLTTVRALRACGGSPDRLLEERILRNRAAAERLSGCESAGEWLAVGPLRFGPRKPVLAGALLVGDAAGSVDPFSGEGMSNALTGAELAVPIVLEAASRGSLDPVLARAWSQRWAGAFASGIRTVRRIGRLFERPRLGRLALGLASAPGGGRVLARIVVSTRTAARARLT